MRHATGVLLWIVLVLCSAISDSSAASQDRNPIRIAELQSEPVIDGHLDEASWTSGTRLGDFYQTQPGDNIKPSYPTEVVLGISGKSMFIGIRAFDDPGKVRATLAKRDQLDADDHLAIYLDTFNDRRKAYVLIFNPLGTQQDGIYNDDGRTDYSVDIVMKSAGAITADGYSIEVAIPLSSLRYATGQDQVWGVHILRKITHLDEENSWMPLTREKTAVVSASGPTQTKAQFLSQAGHLTGVAQSSTGRTLDLIPVFTPSQNSRRIEPLDGFLEDRFSHRPVDADFGLTGKLALTSAFTLTSAYNPDFAEVEADQPQITANQRFPLFFPEKRPFFLEGIEIFSTPIQAIHTRTIVDPDLALKIAGKQGPNSVGILLAGDEAPGNFSELELRDPANARFAGKNAYSGLFRFNRDISDQSTLGMVATSYNFTELHNHLAGFDGRIHLNASTFLTFQVLGTNSKRYFYDPEIDSSVYRTGNGFGYYAEYNRTGRNLNFQVIGIGFTPDYRADLGFLQRTNTNRWSAFASYNSEPSVDSKLISWSFLFTALAQHDWQGRMQYSYLYPRVLLNFKRQTFLNLYAYGDYLRLFEEEFGPMRSAAQSGAFFGDPERSTTYRGLLIQAGTSPTKQYSFNFSYDNAWDFFDYDFGAGPDFPRVSPAALADPEAALDPGAGRSKSLTASAAYQPTESLRVSFEFNRGSLVRNDTGRVAFEQNLYSWNVQYSFTQYTFARSRIDYDSLTGNVRGQFLAGWTPNPGTSLYVGYNEDLNYNGYSPFTNHYEAGLKRNNRTFFIKLSYLFRYEL